MILLEENQMIMQFMMGAPQTEIIRKTLKPEQDEFRLASKWNEEGDVNLIAKSIYHHPEGIQ